MKKILIADSSKASLVMVCEVFKENFYGIQVLVAKTAADALELAKNDQEIDAFIVDYDLPDMSGAQLALRIKKMIKKPILMTAFDKPEVTQEIESLLNKYDDCRSWLRKPVNPVVVMAVVNRFCEGKIRAEKRVSCQIPAKLFLEIDNKNEKNTQISFAGLIEDCSFSGIRVRPLSSEGSSKKNWKSLLTVFENIPEKSKITIEIPSFEQIEFNEFTLNPHSKMPNELPGRVVWANADTGEWFFGIEFDDIVHSKKLLESLVSSKSKYTRMSSLAPSLFRSQR